MAWDFAEEAVEALLLLPAVEICPYLDFPNVLDIKIGVSYFTSEKLFDALVVIFVSQIKL